MKYVGKLTHFWLNYVKVNVCTYSRLQKVNILGYKVLHNYIAKLSVDEMYIPLITPSRLYTRHMVIWRYNSHGYMQDRFPTPRAPILKSRAYNKKPDYWITGLLWTIVIMDCDISCSWNSIVVEIVFISVYMSDRRLEDDHWLIFVPWRDTHMCWYACATPLLLENISKQGLSVTVPYKSLHFVPYLCVSIYVCIRTYVLCTYFGV